MDEHLAHKNDCSVERNLDDYPGQAVMMDCDGNVLFTAPESWKLEQMFHALQIANEAYARGVRVGRMAKRNEIRHALESD